MTDKEEREVLRRYLRQYLSAKRRKCDLERRRAQLQQDMQCPLGAVRYDGMPRSGSPSEGAADTAAGRVKSRISVTSSSCIARSASSRSCCGWEATRYDFRVDPTEHLEPDE